MEDAVHGRQGLYVAMLDRRSRRALAALGAAWLVWIVWAVRWWSEPAHHSSTFGTVTNSALLAFTFVFVPGYFLALAYWAKRPAPSLDVPRLRVAIVVTKAPSEPWATVRSTLEAALRQDLEYEYSVWLADESPDETTLAWCRENGVAVSTREGEPRYHEESWPRRTRSKEGNLAWFYDTFGYDGYDVVAQFDADHVPEPSYLRQVLQPFADPRVGYVAAPSICSSNAEGSWSARGRLYAEATLHGAQQAAGNPEWSACCIGSHYAVRTEALREVGGIGPELAEDFSTSLILSSAGWKGAFAPDATAFGEGPETVADAITQELQWSRSVTNLLLGIGPALVNETSGVSRLRLGFGLFWYPLAAVAFVVGLLLPAVALVMREPFVSVQLGDFALHVLPSMLLLLTIVLVLRRACALRPVDAPIVSWEAILFVFMRMPWVVLGVTLALVGRFTGHAPDWRVTPKGQREAASLPIRVLVPPLLIVILSLAPVLLVDDPGEAGGYRFWAIFNAVLYSAVALALVALHWKEQSGGALRRVSCIRAPLALTACVLGLVGVGSAWGAGLPTGGPATASGPGAGTSTTGAGCSPVEEPRPRIGVTTSALAVNSRDSWGPAALGEVSGFERDTGVCVDSISWFADFQSDPAALEQQLQIAEQQGLVPAVTLEPWDHRLAPGQNQPRYSLEHVAAGRYDGYLQRVGQALATYPGDVRVRFAQESDGVTYPWSTKRFGQRPIDYARAWRHVHSVVTRAGATNVRWIYSLLGTTFDARSFPGSRFVDVIGMSAFNGGTELTWGAGAPSRRCSGRQSGKRSDGGLKCRSRSARRRPSRREDPRRPGSRACGRPSRATPR